MASNASPDLSKKRVLSNFLTNVSHATAPFITTFLLIHLTAPAMATLGGTSLASQAMILGREYYQTSFGEKYLVLAPIFVHAVASCTKRLISDDPKTSPRPVSSTLTWTAAITASFLLPVHFLTHRINPSLPDPPIFSVGPAELDYEFVKLGLSRFPVRSWLLYLSLLGVVTLHASEGMRLIWNTRVQGPLGSVMKRRTSRIFNALIALPAVAGLVVMSQESLMMLSSTADRLVAALQHSIIFRV